jgi:CheY-like chemotaxis protein
MVNPDGVDLVLNGISGNLNYSSSENIVKFSAPDASVLIVDDIKTNLKVAQGLLLPYNMKIDLCNSGREAIEAVKTNHYDLILMDHKMPDMDGVEATQIIRSLGFDYSYYNLPVVALTANAMIGTREFFLDNGFNDFISKPIDTIQLNVVLEKWIPKNKQEARDGRGMEKTALRRNLP